ncbi:MAG: NDP-hexose 2,3-dehydratase [bacterium]|nr:NDP-hexose 2,3-dehydratase [bacterium]
MIGKKELTFLKSALTEENPFIDTEEVKRWLKARNEAVTVDVKRIKFEEMNQWYVHPETGNIHHQSGKFFTIEGIGVKTNWGNVPEWSQPIINQPEVGILGIITKKINGILYFLMQAKIEPGNINNVQISPTLQATKSNYQKVHKGKSPLYLEYFTGKENVTVLLDQLQSEQGARFMKKRNRNIIIEVEGEIEVHDDFCWLTLGQLKKLLLNDNLINMDTRTVISNIPFGDYPSEMIDFYKTLHPQPTNPDEFKTSLLMSILETERHLHEIDDIISWLTGLKTQYELDVRPMPLNAIQKWHRDDYSIYHEQKKYFSVIAVSVAIANREVTTWTQPLIKSEQEGIIAFLVKKINGVCHFLVQAKLEPGNFDIIELAPTVQCLTGNYRDGFKEYDPPYLEYVLTADPKRIHYSALQSEEGGRFFKEQNKNLMIEVEDDFPLEVPENFTWMTLNQVLKFVKFNNYFNIEARSLISATRFI